MSLPPNENWPRWIHASIHKHFKDNAFDPWNASVADHNMPIVTRFDGIEELTQEFINKPFRAELRINGPNMREQSQGCYQLNVQVNILYTICMESLENAYAPLAFGGLVQQIAQTCIPVMQYGCFPGDDDTVLVGTLTTRPRRNENVNLINFAQLNETDEVVQQAIDGQYEMTLQL